MPQPRTRRAVNTAQIDVQPRHRGRFEDLGPEDYGRHHARCSECSAWLNRYHSPTEDGGLCHPCSPGGDGGIVIEVRPGEHRRFQLPDLVESSTDELRAVMEAT